MARTHNDWHLPHPQPTAPPCREQARRRPVWVFSRLPNEARTYGCSGGPAEAGSEVGGGKRRPRRRVAAHPPRRRLRFQGVGWRTALWGHSWPTSWRGFSAPRMLENVSALWPSDARQVHPSEVGARVYEHAPVLLSCGVTALKPWPGGRRGQGVGGRGLWRAGEGGRCLFMAHPRDRLRCAPETGGCAVISAASRARPHPDTGDVNKRRKTICGEAARTERRGSVRARPRFPG